MTLGGRRLARLQQRRRARQGELGVGGDARGGQLRDRRMERLLVAAHQQVEPAAAGEPRQHPARAGGHRMTDRRAVVAVRQLPFRGAPVQLARLASERALPLRGEDVGQQRMDPVPATPRGIGRQQHTRLPELLQPLGRRRRSGQRARQLRPHPVHDREPQQQRAVLLRQAIEDLASEVVADRAVGAGEA